MSTFQVKDGTSIAYKDWGEGQPILFSHGGPLAGDARGREKIPRKRSLASEKGVELLVEGCIPQCRMNGNRDMDCDRLDLPNPIYAVVALILYRRVPPPAQMNDVICGRDGQADAGGFW